MKVNQRYLSYLLRLWQTSDDGEQVWRASLETPGSGERRSFASLKELFAFLETKTGQVSQSDQLNWDFLTRGKKGGENTTD